MKGLDISKMKKVDENDNVATFHHKDGHQVKVALQAVSPELRKQISKLPKHMAQGGDSYGVGKEPIEQEEKYVQPNDLGDEDAQQAKPETQTPNIDLGLEPKPYFPSPLAASPVAALPPAEKEQAEPAAAPETAASQPKPQAASPTAQAPKEEDPLSNYTTQDQAWAQDLASGHIQPKTYHDMFAKNADGSDRGTLSKIGMLFGLMIGGAGAGLSHQPNLLMEMMNKEIQNDLEAQKQSKHNALTMRGLVQQHLMQKSQIKQMDTNTAIQADAFSRMKMNRAAVQDLTNIVNTLPPNDPKRQEAEKTLAAISQGVDNENYSIAQRAAARQSFLKTMFPDQQGAGNEQGFQNQINRIKSLNTPEAIKRAEDMESKHIPGVPGLASRPVNEGLRSTIQAMNVLDDKGKDVLDYIKQNLGTWNPQKRQRAEQKIEEMKNFYNGSIDGGSLTKGRLAWYDEQFAKDPVSIVNNILGSTKRLEEVVDSNAKRRDLLLYGPGGLGYTKSGGSQGGAVRMQAPDGSIKMVPANQVDAAIKAKGKRLD